MKEFILQTKHGYFIARAAILISDKKITFQFVKYYRNADKYKKRKAVRLQKKLKQEWDLETTLLNV